MSTSGLFFFLLFSRKVVFPFPFISTMASGSIDSGSSTLFRLDLALDMGSVSSSSSSCSAYTSYWAASTSIIWPITSLLFLINGSLYHTGPRTATIEELSSFLEMKASISAMHLYNKVPFLAKRMF